MQLKDHQKCLVIAVAACIVVGAGAFAGGMAYGRSASSAAGNRSAANGAAFNRDNGAGPGFANGQGFARNGASGSRTGGRTFGGNVVGEILKMDSQSLTVKLQDGGTRLVFLSDKTTVMKTETAAVTDLVQGTTVRVMGSSNQDGSVMAQNIQIVPAGQAQPMPQPPVEAPVK
jgi:hypothetical protein